MALPTTGYATVTKSAGTLLSDFSVIIDLANMPASWWSAVDTTDGTKGRASKDTTELPCDWIAFDSVNETGLLRVKVPSWATAGNAIRVYPPVAANASVAADATYGSDNAYDSSWGFYWPLEEASGKIYDRTKNNIDSASETGLTYGATGKLGKGLTLDTTDRADFGDVSTFNSATKLTVSAWIKPSNIQTDERILSQWGNAFAERCFMLSFNGTDDILFAVSDTSVKLKVWATNTNAYGTGSWQHVVAVWDGASDKRIYRNADSQSITNTFVEAFTTIGNATASLQLGHQTDENKNTFDGDYDEVHGHTTNRSEEWIEEEYAMTNDNATFWGSWAWTAPSGGTILPFMRRYLHA